MLLNSTRMRPQGQRTPLFNSKWILAQVTWYVLPVRHKLTMQWIASPDCSTASCDGQVTLFDPSDSISSGEEATFNYAIGKVSGEIVWDEVSIGGFDVGYQAFGR